MVIIKNIELDASKTLILNKTHQLYAVVKHNDEVCDKNVKWTSDNPSVAMIDAGGRVKGVSKGTAHITASYASLNAQCTVVVCEEPEIEHEYIDLCLSVKWATYNVGATSPAEYGDYFAWGETEPYYEDGFAQEKPQTHWKDGKSIGYDWSTYKWCNGSYTTMTKYSKSQYGYEGFADDKSTLELEDDVAYIKWGGLAYAYQR